MSPSDSVPIPIDELLSRIQDTLSHTWQETGFGYLAIESERINSNKIRVIIRGSTHYRYIISNEDIRRWNSADRG